MKENLAPLSEDSSDIRIEGHSRLLRLMLITLWGKKHQDEIRDHLRKMKELCLHYPRHQQIVKSYFGAREISGILDEIEEIRAYKL